MGKNFLKVATNEQDCEAIPLVKFLAQDVWENIEIKN